MSRKDFAINLNDELDKLGFPMTMRDRATALSKVLKIRNFQAASILQGDMLPDREIVHKIAMELEINDQWLQEKLKH